MEERWDQSKQYFMEFLTSKKDFEKTTQQSPRYQRIAAFFRKEKFTIVQLAFTIDVSVSFVNFLIVFKIERSLVHIIYNAMKDLLTIVMKRFLKAKVIDGLSGKELQKVDVSKKENKLGDKLEIGAKTEHLLKSLSPFEQKKEWELMLKFYEKTVAYFQKHLPPDNAVLAKAACCHPDNRKKEFTICHIEYLAKVFPQVIDEEKVSQVKDEQRLYQTENNHKVKRTKSKS